MGENMLCTEIVLNVKNNFHTQHVLPSEHGENMSYTEIVFDIQTKIRASDKDLPVLSSVETSGRFFQSFVAFSENLNFKGELISKDTLVPWKYLS